MSKINVAPLGAVLAAALMGSTGYCVFNQQPEPPVTHGPASSPPVRLLPEAVIPYPLTDAE